MKDLQEPGKSKFEVTGGSREERIATRIVMSKTWAGVAGMRKDIDEMAAQVKGWIVREDETRANGGRFTYSQYYGFILDALDECSDKLKKMENRI